MEELLNEQKRTNELLETLIKQKDRDDELLTQKQIVEEFDIGSVKVQKMFNDPELPVQKYTKPFKVKRGALKKYLDVRHDYLCGD